MRNIPLITLSYDELKCLVIDCIKKHGNSFEFKNFCNTVGAMAVRKEIVPNPNPINYQTIYFPLQKENENTVRQILWDLIVDRFLTIGDYHNDTWPWLSVTEKGKRILQDLES